MRLIDANELKENLTRFFPTDCLDGIESKTLFKQMLHDIDNAPTVIERPKGKWRLIDKGEYVSYYDCSICGRGVIADTGDIMSEDFPFCHCGAYMGEGEEIEHKSS